MKSSLAISYISCLLFLSSARANPLPPANPQLDSSEPDFSPTPNLEILLPQQEQQPFPLDATTNSNINTLLSDDNNQPTIPPPQASSRHCNTLLHPRSDDSAEPNMCTINTETSYPAPNWDPNEAWKEYLRNHPPGDSGAQAPPEAEGQENRVLTDESIGTGCPDPYHQDHLCCAGPAGKVGVFSSMPNDISYIQHCSACM